MKRGHLLLVVLLTVLGYLPTLTAQTTPPTDHLAGLDTTRYVPATFGYDTTTYALLEQACAGGFLRIAYGRPVTRVPAPFGTTIAYGDRWNPGANGPTFVFTTTDLTLNGKLLPAGNYVLLTIPNGDTWEVILNANPATTAENYLRQDDVLTLTAPATDSLPVRDTLSFTTGGVTDQGFTLQLTYGDTRLTLAVAAANPLQTYEDRFAGKPAGPDGDALLGLARFLYQTGGDAEEALDYADRSVAWAENCYNLYYRGLILARLGRTDEAVDSLLRAGERAEAENVARIVTMAATAVADLEEE